MRKRLLLWWWEARLTGPRRDQRRRACEELVRLGDPRALDLLVRRLSDADGRVREAACLALGRLRDARAIEPLIPCLGDADEGLQRAARDALVQLGAPALGPLMARLAEPRWAGRAAACAALGRLVDPRAAEPLIAQLNDADGDLREAACAALGKLGDGRAVAPLILRLSDADLDVRAAAGEALENLGEARIARAVLGALEGRPEALEEFDRLREQRDMRAFEPLRPGVDHPEAAVRRVVCEALGRLGDPRALEPLVARLDDRDAPTRCRACRALGRLRDERALEPLIARLTHADQEMRGAACDAIVEIGAAAVKPLAARLGAVKWAGRATACIVLGRLADARAVEPLLPRLEDPDEEVRRAVCQALACLGDSRVVERLIPCLGDHGDAVRRAAGEALAKLGEGRLAGAVLGALACQAQAIGELLALKRQGDLRALKALTVARGCAALRPAAEKALRALGFVPPSAGLRIADWEGRALLPRYELPDWLKEGAIVRPDPLARLPAVYWKPELLRYREPLVQPLGASAGRRPTPAPSVDTLIARLGEADPAAREAACEALGKRGDARAVDPLIERLGDPEPKVRQAAAAALEKLGQGPLAKVVLGALEGRPGAADGLRRLILNGDLRGLPAVIARLEDRDRKTRQAAFSALITVGAPAVEVLTACLAQPHWTLRRAVCQVLGRIGDRRAAESLIARLGDTDPDVRQAAGRALELLGEERLAGAVLGALTGDQAALRGLAAEGDLRSIEPLAALSAAASDEGGRACKALETICGASGPAAGELLCPSCLARLDRLRVSANSPGALCRFACRFCGKAGRMLAGVRQAVVVLDESWGEESRLESGVLRVNWLKRRALFDFDRVEIVQAGDYEVERFCIAVGNDTDESRRARYDKMPCRIAPGCCLSENTVRVLEGMFGEVVEDRQE